MYAGRNPGLAGKTTWKDNLSMKDHSPILKRNLTGCGCCGILILFDQFTKMLAVAHLKNQPSSVLIDGVFELRYLENRGSAFGMMQNKLIILIPVTVVVTLLILYLFSKNFPPRDAGSTRLPYYFCRSHQKFHRPRQTGLCGRFFLFQPDQFSRSLMLRIFM